MSIWLGYLDESQMARRIERRIASSRRRSRAVNFILCAIMLALGVAVILAMVSRLFTAF